MYNNIAVKSVDVKIIDNDFAGLMMTYTDPVSGDEIQIPLSSGQVSQNSVRALEGGVADIEMALASEPWADVTVSSTIIEDAGLVESLTPVEFVFTMRNY